MPTEMWVNSLNCSCSLGFKNLILEFSGESWIEVYVENKLIEAQIFSSGDIYERQIEIPFKNLKPPYGGFFLRNTLQLYNLSQNIITISQYINTFKIIGYVY